MNSVGLGGAANPRTSLADAVARILSAHVSRVQLELRRPLPHQTNRLFDAVTPDGHFIVKEYVRPAEFDEAPVREYWALQALRGLDVAPRAIGISAPGAGFGPFVVYEYLTGVPWGRRRPAPAQLSALAETWVAVHSAGTAGALPARSIRIHNLTSVDAVLAEYQPMASQAALALVTDARSRIERPFELLAKPKVE